MYLKVLTQLSDKKIFIKSVFWENEVSFYA